MNPVALASLIPLLTKIPGALKALYNSKHFWPAVIGGGFVGQELLSQTGKAGERKLSREELALQKAIALASAEASKRATEESRANTKEYVKELAKTKREDQKNALDQAMMQSFAQSQERQLAMIMQAVSGVANSPTGMASPQGSSGGMMGLMRGRY